MFGDLYALGMFVADLFKSQSRLEAENLFLPSAECRNAAGAASAAIAWQRPGFPGLDDPAVAEPLSTRSRWNFSRCAWWHRAGFRALWRWKSRKRAGRPKIDRELRDLIGRMSRENPPWGASRIHGELLMLGFEAASRRLKTHRARWKAAVADLEDISAQSRRCDCCDRHVRCADADVRSLVCLLGPRPWSPTVVVVRGDRHPTAEWLARQITEAFPLASAPCYLARDICRAWANLHRPGQGDGNSRSADHSRVAMARRHC